MGKINREERITAGGFWLSPPGERAKYPYWRIMWYDAADEQTKCTAARRIDREGQDIQGRAGLIRTLAEPDEIAAREALARYADAHPQIIQRAADPDRARALLRTAEALTPEALVQLGVEAAAAKAAAGPAKLIAQEDLPLIACITHYKAVRGPHIKQTTIPDALRNVMTIWGNPMVSELSEVAQERFVARLRAQGIADWTILTRMKCIWSAMNYMARKGYLVAAKIPPRTTAEKWDPPAYLPNRNVKLSIEELAALFDAAWGIEHQWRYLIEETGVAARPFAVCETMPANVDFEVGNIDLLEIEKRGAQTRKRKAIIRCAPTLLAHLKRWASEARPAGHDPHFITYQGRRLRSMKFFRELCRRAGVKVQRKAGAYVVRHTWATWAARCGVPETQRKYVMGQEMAQGAHGFYLHFEPDFCMQAADATELLYHAIAFHMKNARAARALLCLGTLPLDVKPSAGAAAACAAASRQRVEMPQISEDQPEAALLEQAWPHLAAHGLWVMRSPFALRGSRSDFEAVNQGLTGKYIDPDKKPPSE